MFAQLTVERAWGVEVDLGKCIWKGESSRVVEYNGTAKTEARERGINVWKVEG